LLSGSRIPIVRFETLMAYRPDDVLVLPWNLASEIAHELRSVPERGGQLLVAVPWLHAIV
jgi:hypothetical protein